MKNISRKYNSTIIIWQIKFSYLCFDSKKKKEGQKKTMCIIIYGRRLPIIIKLVNLKQDLQTVKYIFSFKISRTATSCQSYCESGSSSYYARESIHDCVKRCSKSQNAVSHLALLLAVMMVAAFLTSLINAVITGRGCCNCCRCCECADVAIKHDQGLLDYFNFFFKWLSLSCVKYLLTLIVYVLLFPQARIQEKNEPQNFLVSRFYPMFTRFFTNKIFQGSQVQTLR